MFTQIDSQLIEKIVRGDSASFQRLFSLYCQPLINFARRYVKDIHIAENIVQDVFVQIWQNRIQLDPSLNIKIYLYTAVKNRAYKHFRRLDVQRRASESLNFVWPAVKTPEDEMYQKEIITAINIAIEKLPKKTRIVFSMNRFDDLTYKEIARILNISIKTVETHMGRALKYLRDHLAHLLTSIIF
jgi:RNA polymerase sigma-70 factor (ECF subfamily)